MGLVGFLKTLVDFPSNIAGSSVEVLDSLWNMKLTWATGAIAFNHSLPVKEAQRSLWFTEKLWVMKQCGR